MKCTLRFTTLCAATVIAGSSHGSDILKLGDVFEAPFIAVAYPPDERHYRAADGSVLKLLEEGGITFEKRSGSDICLLRGTLSLAHDERQESVYLYTDGDLNNCKGEVRVLDDNANRLTFYTNGRCTAACDIHNPPPIVPVEFTDNPAKIWLATSRTAAAITGNIAVSTNRIMFGNGATIALRPSTNGQAGLYALESSSNPVLLNGNKLCGDAPPTHVLLIQNGSSLSLHVFNGLAMPRLSSDLTPQNGFCASYSYESAN